MSERKPPLVLRKDQQLGAWGIAHILSEMVNDAAPLGWDRFIPIAEEAVKKAAEMERTRRSGGGG